MVNQVTIIGILMIVNGSLCVLYGMLLMFMGPFISNIFNVQMQGAQMPPQAQPQMQQMQGMFQVISVVYIVLGAAAALAGVMNIAGGISALRFRSRTFVMVALFFNAAAFGTCYCLPTSLGLMIWGLIVMFQKDVAHAFTLGASGYTADEIKQRMSRGSDYRRDNYRDDDDREERRPPRARDERDKPPDADRPPPPKGDSGEDGIREL